MEIFDLEASHKSGVELIKEREYYDRLVSEVQFLIKYIDNQFFQDIFTENLFSDMRGVFSTFIRQDLRKVYNEMRENPNVPLADYLEREYMNLTILRKCTTNLRYQVKSLVRMRKVRALEFKSTFLQGVSRKLSGEIQALYRQLSGNYKQYFRNQFTNLHENEDRISFACVNSLKDHFDRHFITVMNRFYQLSDAIMFVQELFNLELENEIRNRIASIFFEKQDKIERVVFYFIDDLKKNFIKTVDRNIRSGHDYQWISRGFEQFIENDRFQKLLRKVILKSLISHRRGRQRITSADIF